MRDARGLLEPLSKAIARRANDSERLVENIQYLGMIMIQFNKITFHYLGCFTLLLAILVLSGCVKYVAFEAAYIGKVIDADTREPIEGAVAHGVWHTTDRTSGRAVRSYYDSREALTDKHGEFSIPGQGLIMFSNIGYMGVTIFKSGYEDQTWPVWCSELRIKPSRDSVELEEDRVVFKLKKMTEAKRQKLQWSINRYPHYGPKEYEPKDKCELLNAEIARDRGEADEMKEGEKRARQN